MLKLNHGVFTIAAALLVVPSLVYCYNDNVSDELINYNNNNFSHNVETTASADSFSTLALPISQQAIIINPYNESDPSVNLTTPATGTTVALNNFSMSVYDFITTTVSSIPMTTTTSTTATTPSSTNSLKAISQNEYAQYADDNIDDGRESGAHFFPDGLTDFVQQPPAISGYDAFAQPEPTVPSPPFLAVYDPDQAYYATNEFAPHRSGAGDYVQPTVDTDDAYLQSLPNPVPIAPSLVQPSVYTDEPGTSLLGTTPSAPTPRSTKQSKQILTYKSSADEVLRTFVKDSYLRTPTAILIDTSGTAHDKAQMMWRATLLPSKSTLPNAALDMVLVTYNSSGIGEPQNFKNSKSLVTQLDQMAASSSKGGQAFNGIIRASEMIPYDSAIFLSTQFEPTDYDLEHLAAITLLKKRIRLYLIWFGARSLDENDTSAQGETGGRLGELALRTGGEVLHVPDEAFGADGDLGLITLFIQNNLRGPGHQEFVLPVDSTVSSLLIKTLGNVEGATLITPDGRSVDLTSRKAVEAFSGGSTLHIGTSMRAKSISVVLELQPHTRGNYRLRTKARGDYSVDVKGKVLPDQAEVFVTDKNGLKRLAELDAEKNVVKTLKRSARKTSNAENYEDNDDDTPYTTVDNVNNSTSRNLKNILPSITKIDVGLQSQLIAAPGATVQLYFEVSNLRQEPSFHNFQVTDEKSYLRTLQPQGLLLAPGQTQTVVVTAFIPQNAEIGSSDKIVFKSQGIGSAQQAVVVFVSGTGSGNQDNWQPHIWYTYGSRCEGKSTPGTCAGGIWSLDITAQDYESGILRIDSTPKGVIYLGTYTAGTQEPVKATYTASCCNPRVSITVYDLNKNQRAVQLDVYDIWLNEAGIAAVVLGCLLLILLIVLLIILCVWCARKRKRQQELAIYTSGQRSARPSRQERAAS